MKTTVLTKYVINLSSGIGRRITKIPNASINRATYVMYLLMSDLLSVIKINDPAANCQILVIGEKYPNNSVFSHPKKEISKENTKISIRQFNIVNFWDLRCRITISEKSIGINKYICHSALKLQ
jgi:hypothetical protein